LKEITRQAGAHYYNIRAVENVSDFGRNMILKGSIAADDGENGGGKFIKTLYEIRPAYFVSRDK
jgi:hypothetical protein